MSAATGALLLLWGFLTGAVVVGGWAWLSQERELRNLRKRMRAVDACLARAAAELETGVGLAEADDFARWSAELREEAS